MRFFARIAPRGIRIVRRRLALTQFSFGRLLGVSGTLVCMWERGKRKPDVLHTVVLEQMLRMTDGDCKIRDGLSLIPSKPLPEKYVGTEELVRFALGVVFCYEPARTDPVRYVQQMKGTDDDAE